MDTHDGICPAACDRLKTPRRRQRLQRRHREQQLRAFYRKEQELRQQQRALPLVPLETPYQKGWKRFFVLRDDVARSKYADFYQQLLSKINTVTYSPDRSFRVRKRRKRRGVYEVKPQTLRELEEWDWHSPKLGLTDAERQQFHPKEVVSKCGRYTRTRYVFNEPWRYVLRIRPHMITHVRLLDADLEEALHRLDNYLTRNGLRPAMYRLVWGSNYNRWYRQRDTRARHAINNQPLHRLLAAAADETI